MDNSKIKKHPDGFAQNTDDSQFSKHPTDYAISAPTVDAVSKGKKKNKKRTFSANGGIIFVFIIFATIFLIGLNFFFGSGSGVSIRGSKQGISSESKDEETSSKNNRFRRKNSSGTGVLKIFAPASSKLIAEIMEIQREKGDPKQVFQRDLSTSENVSAQLAKEFSTMTEVKGEQDPQKQPQKTVQETLREGISRTGEWKVNEETLQNLESLTDSFKPQRDRIRDFLNDPEAKFEQDMRMTEDGLVPDEKNVDYSWSYLTLEEYAIGEALENDDIDTAVESLLYMLRFTELTSHAKFPTMRIQAGFMRENTLRILQTLVHHQKFSKEHAEKVIRTLRQQLKDWPPDYQCWVGDRADGMRFFELIYQGRLSQALSEEDQALLRSLDSSGREKTSAKGSDLLGRIAFYRVADCDADQDFYLRNMRKLIDSCTKPFYRRIATLDAVSDELQLQRGNKNFPAISMLLLQGIREGMQKQAMDKARVEVWYLALAITLKHNVKEGAVDPVLGKPYHIARTTTDEGDMVIVSTSNESPKAQIKVFQ